MPERHAVRLKYKVVSDAGSGEKNVFNATVQGNEHVQEQLGEGCKNHLFRGKDLVVNPCRQQQDTFDKKIMAPERLMRITYYYSGVADNSLVISDGAERAYPWHVHAGHWTVGSTLSGNAVWHTKNGRHTALPGEFRVLAPCEAHALDVSAGTRLAVFSLNSSVFLVDDFISQMKDLVHSVLHATVSGTATYSMPVGDLRHLASCVNSLSLVQESNVARGEGHRAVQAAICYLAGRHENCLPLSVLSASYGVSLWHFIRLFRLETGMTPHAFHLACRIGHARVLLKNKTAAVEAAVYTGFTDQSHMLKVFRRHHGLTPKQFLRSVVKLA